MFHFFASPRLGRQLFLPSSQRKHDLPFPRQKLLVMSCLFSTQGARSSAQKWQDMRIDVAEREHPAAQQRG